MIASAHVPDHEVPTPQHFHDLLARLAELLEAQGVAYMLVGAVAVGVWGCPRATAYVLRESAPS